MQTAAPDGDAAAAAAACVLWTQCTGRNTSFLLMPVVLLPTDRGSQGRGHAHQHRGHSGGCLGGHA
jgi:hypothetical protein